MVQAQRHRSAIRKETLSAPLDRANSLCFLLPTATLFDYGCGRGDDVRALNKMGIQATGWDPAHQPNTPKTSADIVSLGYVVNAIEDPRERTWVLKDAWSLAKKLLIVAARLRSDRKNLSLTPHADGGITSIGTFQKFYEQEELRDWIDSLLGEQSVPAAPGIFFVFRDTEEREQFLSKRYRRRTSRRSKNYETLEVFETDQDFFHKLADFWEDRGRLPTRGENGDLGSLGNRCGSIRRAFTILQKATGADHWDKVRADRREDLIVYLALARFGRRPKMGRLPKTLQLDIKALFGSYSKGCTEADRILFSLGDPAKRRQEFRQAHVGKQLPTALYVHISAFDELPPRHQDLRRLCPNPCRRSRLRQRDQIEPQRLQDFLPRISEFRERSPSSSRTHPHRRPTSSPRTIARLS